MASNTPALVVQTETGPQPPRRPTQLNAERSPLSPESKVRVQRALKDVRTRFRNAWAASHLGLEAGMETGGVFTTEAGFADLMYKKSYKKCTIKVMEYSSLNVWESKKLSNSDFIDYIRTKATDPTLAKVKAEQWQKPIGVCNSLSDLAKRDAKITWIDIAGISWDVVKELQRTFSIHPLSVEEIMAAFDAEKEAAYSKVEYFEEHLYVRVARHKLANSLSFSDMLRKNMAMPTDPAHDTAPKEKADDPAPASSSDAGRKSVRGSDDVDDSAPVQIEPIFLILNRDFDTVITISYSEDGFTDPISLRMRTKHFSVLRKVSDASLLVHSLLDLVVEEAALVVNQFDEQVRKIEQELLRWHLSNLGRETLQHIHLAARDLTITLSTLRPIRDVICTIRNQDAERFRALPARQQKHEKMHSMSATAGLQQGHRLAPEKLIAQRMAIANSALSSDTQFLPVRGYFTPYARVYMADLLDRIEDILANVEKLHDITENLSDHAFNAKAFELNEIMRIMTLVSVLFLPLSILTAYFGMNFEDLSATRHTESFFWMVAIPFVLVLTPLFFIGDVRRQIMSYGSLHPRRHTASPNKIYSKRSSMWSSSMLPPQRIRNVFRQRRDLASPDRSEGLLKESVSQV